MAVPRALGPVLIGVGVVLSVCALRVRADDMDPALTRLVQRAGNGPCMPMNGAAFCPDHEAFEHLASELAVALSPAVETGAAGLGARGFYLGLSSTATPIRAGQRYWAKGTRGSSLGNEQNSSVDSMLAWNRVDIRKGLPFGLELGSSFGYGMNTSLWLLAVQVRAVLFEGFHSGLGALPDIALRGVTQAMFGSSELSVRTHALDVTLSKPFVIFGSHRLTPLLALQALFVNARSGRIDLTPNENAWATCVPSTTASDGATLVCTNPQGNTELANLGAFRNVNQTRVRLFLGAEERYSWLSVAATLGVDLAVPELQTEFAGDGPSNVMRQVSFHFACGVRY